jgi:dihydroflavonol-4-reductase
MKALVLGGSGLIGNAIVRSLIARRYQVTVVSRRATPPPNLVDVEVRFVSGSVDEHDKLDEWIADHDVVVDAAAPYALNLFHSVPDAKARPLEHARLRTEALLSSAMRHDVRLAYVGALSKPRPRTTNGFEAWQSRFMQRLQPYFEIKETIERLYALASRHGLRTVVVKPSACFGPWDIKPREQCWVPALLSGEIPVTLQHRLNVVDTRDVANTLVSALESESYGSAIPVTGHNTSVSDLCCLLCELAGVASPKWSVPAALGVLPTLWAELAWGVVGRPSPLPSLIPMLLCEQEWTATDPSQTKLGCAPRALSATASDAIAWYRSIGYC